MNDVPMFEIWFELTLPGGDNAKIAGAWPESRPVPNVGDLIFLTHPDLGEKIFHAKVLGLAPVYSASSQLVNFAGRTPIPLFAKLLVVMAEAEPVTKEEEREFPPLRLVKPQA